MIHECDSGESATDGGSSGESSDLPPLSEFLLTAADVLNNLKLNKCKLVVLSTCHTRDQQHGVITTDGLVALTR